ncbi:DUF4007 family protein [Plebeiibacterium sediminum]|uniref:DUF4007 family protein n=1 Tax=Plebeiibacterium sediminum TaxID=2992112 RepID=A0AAE3M751_9BACT|nr:DUF4007 family protein [Plebeiobacterium sediminum]MCW3788489.1 DUF4007 family protein [Plebeiobacterium sediminum]
MKYTFSGHETFYCRHYWLKKGYDFLKEGNNFNDPDAVTKLGVGKNMVTSIRFWLRAFDIIEETKDNKFATDLGTNLFEDESWDPYLEDINSIWLLHYHLIKKGWASIYTLFFNKLKNGDKEFSNEKILRGLTYLTESAKQETPNVKTLDNDIRVFRSNYLQPRKSVNIEDEFNGLLQELHLFEEIGKKSLVVQNTDREDISIELFLYSILDRFEERNSISAEEIITSTNSPGKIFCMTEHGIIEKLKMIEEKYQGITFSENAGVRELQISKEYDKWNVLSGYYE